MTSPKSPIAGQLEAYEESWKRSHLQAMLCRDVEQALAVGLHLFRLIKDDYDLWRQRVATGALEFSKEDESAKRENFTWWLKPRDLVAQDVNRLIAEGYEVDNYAAVEKCLVAAQTILENWLSPVRSKSHVYHEMLMDDDEADRLEDIIRRGKSSV